MSNKAKLLTSAASAVAPDPFGGLTEPLLTNKHEDKVGDEHCEEKDSWSSFSFIIGAIILGAAGYVERDLFIFITLFGSSQTISLLFPLELLPRV